MYHVVRMKKDERTLQDIEVDITGFNFNRFYTLGTLQSRIHAYLDFNYDVIMPVEEAVSKFEMFFKRAFIQKVCHSHDTVCNRIKYSSDFISNMTRNHKEKVNQIETNKNISIFNLVERQNKEK